MNLDIVDLCVPDGICDLRAVNGADLLAHIGLIGLSVQIRHVIDHCGDSLRDCRSGNNHHFLVSGKGGCLIGCHDNVLIVRKDKYNVSVDTLHSFKNIIRAGVHSLSAADHIIDTESGEDLPDTVADRYCDKADFLSGLFRHLGRLCLSRLFLLRAFGSGRFAGFRAFAAGFSFLEIEESHLSQFAEFLASLNDQAGIVGLTFDMEDISIHRALYAVSEGLEEFQILFLISGRRLLGHQHSHPHFINKAELLFLNNFFLGLGFRLFFFLLDKSAVVDLFAKESVVSSLHDLHKTLSAGVNYARLLEDRQQLRCVGKNLLRLFKNRSEKCLQVFFSCIGKFSGLKRSTLGYGKDRAFLGLHDSFISGLHSSVKAVRQNRDCELCLRLGYLSESADQLGENNTRITSGSPQRP